MRRKYLLWSLVLTFTILPIVIEVNLKEELQRLSTFLWSLFIIPNTLIMFMFPKWKVIIGTGLFYCFLKFFTQLVYRSYIGNLDLVILTLDSIVNLSILLTIGYFRLSYNKLLNQMQKLSIMDSLTGLYNRRYFDLYMEKTIPMSQRINYPLIFIMVDIDRFKKINDNYGHLCGDKALKHISEIIKRNVRNSDAYVRYGGEEFAIILPNTQLDEGRTLADRIRKTVEQSNFIYNNEAIHLTVSMGVSLYEGESVDSFIEKADKALYRAKANGRNQVVVFGR